MLCCLAATTAFSQKNTGGRKAVFAHLPQTISLSKNTLQNTLIALPGDQISINFNNGFVFSGTVLSNEYKYDNLQSMIIRSTAYGNTLFQLSKITNPDKTSSFTGRIMNPESLDGYEIKRDSKDQYCFQKFETGKILQDCRF